MKKILYTLIVFLLISAETNAQFCNKYADKAVSQYQLAKKNNLPGINWPLWTDDWNGHLNWCKTVSHDVADKETAKRQAYLDKYLKNNKTPSKEDFCNTYADTAVKQYNRAKQLFNPKGPEWSNDRNEHYNWCMQVPENVAKDREGIRQAHIDEYYGAQIHDQSSPATDNKENETDTKGNETDSWSDIPKTQDEIPLTKVGGRSALGTSMATTYMDMHHLFIPHKNNCSSTEAFVPLWLGAELGFCMDKDLHHSGIMGWSSAVRTCLSENKRLPELWEWETACDEGLISVNDKSYGEWGGNFPIPIHTDTRDGMAVPILGLSTRWSNRWGYVSSTDLSSKVPKNNIGPFRCVH